MKTQLKFTAVTLDTVSPITQTSNQFGTGLIVERRSPTQASTVET